ncbi:MAG TPA: hypothetical protein VHO68_01100, partial [Bacteroidales bacterium]|nr:hypothetical protein [Bacteroidales bacterium]
VLNYFGSGGADTSAINTPVTNLKYYGQSYDNIVTFITQFLNIEDVYTFRNLMSALVGWLTFIITALFAVSLGGYRTGILVLFLFSVSPSFFGHSLNNLKDVPFAFAYIAGTWFITKFISKSGKTSVSSAIFLTLSIAFCISIRAGGLILICYLFMYLVLHYVLKYYETRRLNINELIRKTSWIFPISLISVLLGSLLWPFALRDPLKNIFESYRIMAHYPLTFRQIFEGRVEWSDFMPWYYLLKSMAITIPLLVLGGFIIFFLFSKKVVTGKNRLVFLFVVFTVLFPLFFVILEKSNLYSSWRQFLFVYPAIVLLSATGISFLFDLIEKKIAGFILVFIIILAAINPALFMLRNHPYEYIYYNELAGGVNGAYGNYELDYYYTSQTEASEWLINYLEEKKTT